MAISEKETRYRWREGKERELMEFVKKSTKRGSTVTAALKEYGEKHGISWLTARWKYYQMRRRLDTKDEPFGRVESAAEPDAGGAGELGSADDDFLTALSALIGSSQDIGEDVVSLIRGFSRMAGLARETVEVKQQLSSAIKDLDKSKQNAQRAKKLLERLDEIIVRWQQLPSVEKVNTLREFEQSLEAERSGIARAIEFLDAQG